MKTKLLLLALAAAFSMQANADQAFRHTDNVMASTPTITRGTINASEIPAGVIRTEAEKQKAEEERRRQQEEEDRIKREEEEAERKRIAAEKRENSFWNKAIKGIKKFGKTIVEEED